MVRSSSYIKVIGSRSRSNSRLQEQKECMCMLFAGGVPSIERQSYSLILLTGFVGRLGGDV